MSTLSGYYQNLTSTKIRMLQNSGAWLKVIIFFHDTSTTHHHHNTSTSHHHHDTSTSHHHHDTSTSHHHHDSNSNDYTPHYHTNYTFYIHANHISYIKDLIPIRLGFHLDFDSQPSIINVGDNTIHYIINGITEYHSLHHHHDNSGTSHHHSNNTTHHHDNVNHSVTHTHGNATLDASNNLSIGFHSLNSLTTGINNTAIGFDTLHKLTSGINNLAIGNEALSKVTVGNANIGLGSKSLYNNIDGDSNTCIGYEAGKEINGNNNVVIGKLADTSAPTSNNEIVIGHDTTGIGSNMAVIGNDDITKIYAAHDGGAVIYTAGIVHTSDSRIKKNVNDLDGGLNFISSLRPVIYNRIMPKDYPDEIKKKMYPKGVPRQVSNDECNKNHVGLIAQEVNDSTNLLGDNITNLVNFNIDTGLYSLSYDSFVVPIIKAIQELKIEKDEQIEAILAKLTL